MRDQIKHGLEVLIYSRSTIPSVGRVIRIMQTQFLVARVHPITGKVMDGPDLRYSLNTGHLVGTADGWNTNFVKVPTPEELKEVREKLEAAILMKQLLQAPYHKYSLEWLRDAVERLPENARNP